MGDEAYCSSDTVSAAVRRRRRRRRRDQSYRSFTCVSPWMIFSRWFSGGNSKIGENVGINNRRNELVRDFQSLSSEEVEKCCPSNLGAGFDLLYLVAASRNELCKMAALHKQMEIMLRNFQAEFRNDEDKTMAPCFSNSNDVRETLYVEEQVSHNYLSTSYRLECPGIHFSDCLNKIDKNVRIDQIEDELVSELNRMQLQLDSGVFPKYSKQQHLEINVEGSAPEMSLTANFEEICENPEEVSSYGGVDPRELETRLHEVFEARQQEEINELESALEHSTQQLEIKERELAWWKNTVSFISQHVKEPAV